MTIVKELGIIVALPRSICSGNSMRTFVCPYFLTVILFPISIQSNFTLTLSDTAVKKIKITIAAVTYIRQYQVNFNLIELTNMTFWCKADLYLSLNNTKKVSLL